MFFFWKSGLLLSIMNGEKEEFLTWALFLCVLEIWQILKGAVRDIQNVIHQCTLILTIMTISRNKLDLEVKEENPSPTSCHEGQIHIFGTDPYYLM